MKALSFYIYTVNCNMSSTNLSLCCLCFIKFSSIKLFLSWCEHFAVEKLAVEKMKLYSRILLLHQFWYFECQMLKKWLQRYWNCNLKGNPLIKMYELSKWLDMLTYPFCLLLMCLKRKKDHVMITHLSARIKKMWRKKLIPIKIRLTSLP
jgi:hypothetical protein